MLPLSKQYKQRALEQITKSFEAEPFVKKSRIPVSVLLEACKLAFKRKSAHDARQILAAVKLEIVHGENPNNTTISKEKALDILKFSLNHAHIIRYKNPFIFVDNLGQEITYRLFYVNSSLNQQQMQKLVNETVSFDKLHRKLTTSSFQHSVEPGRYVDNLEKAKRQHPSAPVVVADLKKQNAATLDF